MKTFLYRTHIKVICGVLSTVLLSAAGLCFALIVWMAAAGGGWAVVCERGRRIHI